MDIIPHQKLQSNRLLQAGVFLFLLGLLTGFAIPMLANPRMGLSSHMEGVLNGMFLIGIGLLWQRLQLSERMLSITFWLLLYGTFVNWLAILLAAIWAAGKTLPIAGLGNVGTNWQEAVINFMLYSLSVAMVLTCIFVLIGLGKANKTPEEI